MSNKLTRQEYLDLTEKEYENFLKECEQAMSNANWFGLHQYEVSNDNCFETITALNNLIATTQAITELILNQCPFNNLLSIQIDTKSELVIENITSVILETRILLKTKKIRTRSEGQEMIRGLFIQLQQKITELTTLFKKHLVTIQKKKSN